MSEDVGKGKERSQRTRERAKKKEKDNPWWVPEHVRNIGDWKACLVCIVLTMLCATIFMDTLVVNDPVPRYEHYLNVEEDGFEFVYFHLYKDVDKRIKSVRIEKGELVALTEVQYLDGLFYDYTVIYLNGTVLESELSFLPYGTNRTILDFDEVYMELLQIQDGIRSSKAEIEAERFILGVTGAATFILGIFSLVAYGSSGERRNRYGRGYR